MKHSLRPISSLLPKCLAPLILEDEWFAQKGRPHEQPVPHLRCHELGDLCAQSEPENPFLGSGSWGALSPGGPRCRGTGRQRYQLLNREISGRKRMERRDA